METYLRKIGNGEGAADHFLNNIAKFLDSLIQNVPSHIEKTSFQVQSIPSTATSPRRPVSVADCPTCKQGKILTRKGFYGCSAYKDGCKQTFPGIFLKKKITAAQVKLLCTTGQTNMIKGFVAKNGNKFNASLKLEGEKKTEQLTDSMFYIMSALTKPRHGYAIMNLIEETTKGAVTIGPASMYTIIKKLLNQEWIYLHDKSDSRRKTYQLTENGRKILKEDIEVRKLMIELAEAGLGEE